MALGEVLSWIECDNGDSHGWIRPDASNLGTLKFYECDLVDDYDFPIRGDRVQFGLPWGASKKGATRAVYVTLYEDADEITTIN